MNPVEDERRLEGERFHIVDDHFYKVEVSFTDSSFQFKHNISYHNANLGLICV
jgi:hypothetical protein